MRCYVLLSLAMVVVLASMFLDSAEGSSYGHDVGGTACIVKGSYCNCHYCKCEKGWVWCGHKHGYGEAEDMG